MLTSSEHPSDVERCKQFDFVKGYAVKPVSKNEMVTFGDEAEIKPIF
jgi:hypothetical protein